MRIYHVGRALDLHPLTRLGNITLTTIIIPLPLSPLCLPLLFCFSRHKKNKKNSLFNCLKSTILYFPAVIRNNPIRDSDVSRFNFAVYGLELLVSVWFVIIVTALVFACLFGCVSSPILTDPLYVSFCTCVLPKRHMMRFHV